MVGVGAHGKAGIQVGDLAGEANKKPVEEGHFLGKEGKELFVINQPDSGRSKRGCGVGIGGFKEAFDLAEGFAWLDDADDCGFSVWGCEVELD